MKDYLRMVACFVLISTALSTRFVPQCLAQEQTSEVYEFHKAGENGITAPKPLYQPNPEYTDRARRKKINGVVLLSVVVTPEGSVRDATVTRTLDKDLDKQALNAVKTWKFQPATRDGNPVAVRIAVEVSFRVR